MKANRLAKSELKKMFLRPAVYFMTAFLVLTLIIISFSYNPTTRDDNLTKFGTGIQTVSETFADFNSSTSTLSYSKKMLDLSLTETKDRIVNYSTTVNTYEELCEKVDDIDYFMNATGGTTLYETHRSLSADRNNTAKKSNFMTALHTLSGKALNIYQFFDSEITANNIDFYAKTSSINQLKESFFKLYQISNTNISDTEKLLELGSKIRSEYNLDSSITVITNFPKIEMEPTAINNITEKYYTNIAYQQDSETILTTIFNEINSYAIENGTSLEPEKKLELNKLITKYKNCVNIAISLLNNSFEIQKAGTYSTNEVRSYIGFSQFNAYIFNENITLNTYLLENQIFDGNYLLNFNILSTSGVEASAYDFTFFSMQILSIILTIFCLFYAVSILAGEQTNGTMKMLAMRPFSRDKIIDGKILACVYFMLVFMIVSTVASFVVGYTMFGLESANVLLVFNSSSVLAIPPYFVLLLYLISISISIIFYILMASLLSVIFRSNIFAMFITFLMYFFGILFSMIYSGQFWYNFTPYAHLDIFKFFGNSNNPSTLLGMNMTIDGNFFVSAVYIVVAFTLISVITKIVFRKRDIA